MPSFQGRDGGTWKGGSNQSQGSTVYGKLSGAWAYAKSAWVKKDGTWQRAWTDCRAFDATGGRDWTTVADTPSDTYSGTCGNRTRTDYTTYTKTGCPDDVRSSTVSDPNCTSGCFTPSAVNCDGCGSRTYYDGSATNCTSYYEGTCGTWTSANIFSPTCYPLTNGTYPYASGSLWGWIYYTDPGCNNAIASCSGGGLVGPYDVQHCSASGLYRVTGGDVCVYPSCC